MSASSLSTVRYLRHHMKNMEVSGSSFSTPQLQSQMRVTVTGIVQEALYFLVSSWIITKICLFQNLVSTVDLDNHILVTVFTLYCFGTTINLGVGPQGYFQFAVNAVAVLAIEANMISCGCLSAFYFTQIVPPRRSYFIWIKRNIKTIIYLGLLLYYFYFLIEWIVIGLVFYDVFSQSRTDHTNSTSGAGPVQNLSGNVLGLSSSINTMIGCRIFVIWMSLGVMTLSSCTTVRYLRRHMKNMESSSISFSSPQLQSQMRVTIIGIVQGLLYLLCALWFCVDVWLRAIEFIIFDIDRHISLTVYSLYCLGSSVNLGVGQSLFRQRANTQHPFQTWRTL
uniref:Taste receptor type 2 n=1 Tax=Denticeps clupeoides TaxID=299321 RepID=A0AAY4D633_9TELE